MDKYHKYLTLRIRYCKQAIFGASPTLLSELYISLEKLVLSQWMKTPSESYKCVKILEEHFDFLQFIQGDLVKNKFYLELDLIKNRIVDIISNSPIPSYDETAASLRDLLVSNGGVNLQNMISRIKNTNGPPSLLEFENLRISIIDRLKPYITTTQLDKILFLVDNYKASIVSYHNGIDLLSKFKDGYRKALIIDLTNSKFTTILQECSSVSILSHLLTGDKVFLETLLSSRRIYNKIQIHNLRHIKLRVKFWTVNDFNAYGYMDQATLDLLKEEIISKIDGFISYEKLSEFNEKYDIDPKEERRYDRHWYVQPGYESELEATQEFYNAAVAFTGDPKTSLHMLAKLIGHSHFNFAGWATHFSLKVIRKIVSKLDEFIKKDTIWRIPPSAPAYDFMGRLPLAQRQQIYESTKEVFENYMKEQGIDRQKNWNDEHIKGYHIIRLLKRNLGFDILSFTTLDKESFISTNAKNQFSRHHFRDSFFRKLSNYVHDLILTDGSHHNQYRGYGEAQMQVILDGFDKMMNIDGSGKDADGNPTITIEDLEDVFKGNEWVLRGPLNPDGTRTGGKDGNQGWFFNGKFNDMLTIFNDRKSKLINNGLDQFLIEDYDTVYERFYLNYPHKSSIADAHGFYSFVQPHPWLADFAVWMNYDDVYPLSDLPVIR